MLDVLRTMLAAVAPNRVLASDITESFDYLMAAQILRYEKICEPLINQAITDHVGGIVNKQSARRARDSYTKDYFLNLNLPYSGIQSLCGELCRVFRKYGVVPTAVQIGLANGQFDWKTEFQNLQDINSL